MIMTMCILSVGSYFFGLFCGAMFFEKKCNCKDTYEKIIENKKFIAENEYRKLLDMYIQLSNENIHLKYPRE